MRAGSRWRAKMGGGGGFLRLLHGTSIIPVGAIRARVLRPPPPHHSVSRCLSISLSFFFYLSLPLGGAFSCSFPWPAPVVRMRLLSAASADVLCEPPPPFVPARACASIAGAGPTLTSIFESAASAICHSVDDTAPAVSSGAPSFAARIYDPRAIPTWLPIIYEIFQQV